MQRYYYANGERQLLDTVNDRLALDTKGAEVAGLGDDLPSGSSKLPGGMTIVDRAALDPDLIKRLRAAGVVQPVYRSGKALVVLMPEVRVELEGDQHARAMEAFHASQVAADITDDTPERISLKPQSGSAEDALDLANFIFEKAHPAAASVRMLHIVPKPGNLRDK